jgi:hypothetical protein
MSDQHDAATLALTGQLPMVLLVAVPLAFLCSFILLRIYLRAVKRSMMRHSGSVGTDRPDETALPASGPPPKELQIVEAGAEAGASSVAGAPGRGALMARWRAAAVYGIAGIACALTMTTVYLGAKDIGFLPIRFAFVAITYAWPLVLTIGVVATISRREWLTVSVLYFAIAAAIVAPSLNEDLGWLQVGFFWSIMNAPATLIVMGFLVRRIRAVGPMVLAFMIAAVGGATINMNLVGTDPERIRWIVNVGTALGLDGRQTFYAMMLFGALVVAAVGWLLLLWFGRLYRARRVSDQSIIVDSIWFMFAVVHGMDFVFVSPRWFLAAIGAFLIYKLVALAGFRLLRRWHAGEERPPRLLLLRVFSLGKRSEKLFDSFAKVWRYWGGIRMIAGPDLATSTVEPHEFLDFLTGKLARRFIRGRGTFERRLAEADERRDFDGRYRVSDFFCHDDTWKMVLSHLARDSDAILMDLRGFAPQHQGCVYEIRELMNEIPLERVLFVVDATTDEAFLRKTFADCWTSVPARSPNVRSPAPRVCLFRLTGKGKGSIPALVREVAAAASTPYAVAPA